MKKNRKGFTIVELVIVIAVIAILAAVLIPTFANLIKRANVSNDISVAKNLNTALTVAEATGEINSVNDAVTALKEEGFSIGNLNPSAEGNYYVWDSKSNQILYVDGTQKILYSSKANPGAVADWWLPVSATAKMDEKFSNFLLTEDEVISASMEFTKPVGLTVMTGKTLAMISSAEITVTTEDAGTIIFDGSFVGNATVEAPNCDLYTEGTMDGLTITRIDGNSAHINSFVQNLTYNAGHVVIEPKGYVANWNDKSTEAVAANSIEIKGVIANLAEVGAATYTINEGTIIAKAETVELPNGLTEENIGANEEHAWEIASVADLLKFRDAVNGGYSFAGVTVELTADLDLSGMNWNIPIGAAVTYEPDDNTLSFAAGNPFKGIFNGKGHTIKGLTMLDIPDGGYGGGLFGYCYNATIYNFNLVDVTIDSEVACSPVASFLFFWSCVADINITGKSKSNWSAGIASYAQYGVRIENCNIDMDFEMSNYGVYNYMRMGGVIGQYNNDWEGRGLEIINTDVSKCTFTMVAEGDKTSKAHIGGYVAQYTGGTLTADYKNASGEVVRYVLSKTNGAGDIDPTLLGISVNKVDPNGKLIVMTYNLTSFPATAA